MFILGDIFFKVELPFKEAPVLVIQWQTLHLLASQKGHQTSVCQYRSSSVYQFLMDVCVTAETVKGGKEMTNLQQ